MANKMTRSQRIFCDEYLIDCNATRAYKVAYKNVTKDETAAAAGARLLRNVKVKKYIDEKLEEISDKKIAKVDEVMEFLSSSMRGEITEEIVVTENVGDFMSKAKVIKKQLSAKERIKSAELLGRRYVLFTDKKDIDIKVPEIVFDIKDDENEED